jgi:hypothetical protein
MKPISRKSAVAAGLKWYFTGAPCKFGHTAERQCSNRKCRMCSLIKGRAWRAENPEKSKEIARRWKANNPARNAETMFDWRARNRKKVSEYNRAYISAWVEKNRDKVRYANALRRSKVLEAAPSWLTEEQRQEIKQAYGLAKELELKTGIRYHVDHVVPLRGRSVSGLHVPWNLQVIPSSENLSKGNK